MGVKLEFVLLGVLLMFTAVCAAVYFTMKIMSSRRDEAVFDERQKLIKSRLTTEALLLCISMCLVNGWVMDFAYQWAESNLAAMLMIAVICTVYWAVRCTAKGCAAAVSNTKAQKRGFAASIICAACCLPINLSGSGETDYAVRNGQLTNKFMFTASLIILIACAVFLLFAVRREEKINESGVSK